MPDLKDFGVFITNNPDTTLKSCIDKLKPSSIVVLVDENTMEFCYPLIKDSLPEHYLIQITSGEENKNLSTCQHIWSKMTEFGLDRKALLLNLGGGVIGDMGGFCAATFKRGIRFIQLPTTLLSQVDASVGGKLGIDFDQFKNHIGVFQIPDAVIIYTGFLATLDPRELRSGYAEVIKHALIADKTHWSVLKQEQFPLVSWDSTVQHSVEIKAHVTQNDPTEKGLRKILNFGHTIGHAIESYYLPTAKKLLHGEAIAIGMICEAYVASQKGFISKSEVEEIKSMITSVFDKPQIPENDINDIIPLTMQDKKNENKVVQAALLASIGEANYDIALSANDILTSIKYYNS